MDKNREIEEMARAICGNFTDCKDCASGGDCRSKEKAEEIYIRGYRKQSEGENVATYPSSAFECSKCHWQDWDLLTADSAYNYCPNCGAKMTKGDVD